MSGVTWRSSSSWSRPEPWQWEHRWIQGRGKEKFLEHPGDLTGHRSTLGSSGSSLFPCASSESCGFMVWHCRPWIHMTFGNCVQLPSPGAMWSGLSLRAVCMTWEAGKGDVTGRSTRRMGPLGEERQQRDFCEMPQSCHLLCAGLLSSLCAYCLPKLADKTAAPFAVMCLFSSFLQPPEKPFSKPWGYVLLSEEAGLPYFCKPYIESGLLKDVSCSQLSTQDWSRKGWLCWGSSISEGRGTYSCVRSKKRNIITFWWSHVPI